MEKPLNPADPNFSLQIVMGAGTGTWFHLIGCTGGGQLMMAKEEKRSLEVLAKTKQKEQALKLVESWKPAGSMPFP